jgi:hypothetical protein
MVPTMIRIIFFNGDSVSGSSPRSSFSFSAIVVFQEYSRAKLYFSPPGCPEGQVSGRGAWKWHFSCCQPCGKIMGFIHQFNPVFANFLDMARYPLAVYPGSDPNLNDPRENQ